MSDSSFQNVEEAQQFLDDYECTCFACASSDGPDDHCAMAGLSQEEWDLWDVAFEMVYGHKP